jgi:hypothetical protein
MRDREIRFKERMLAGLVLLREAKALSPADKIIIENLIRQIKSYPIEDNKENYRKNLAKFIDSLIAIPNIHRAILETSEDNASLPKLLSECTFLLAVDEVAGFKSLIQNKNNPIEETERLIESLFSIKFNRTSNKKMNNLPK